MSERYRPYPDYRDSKYEQFGKIPRLWGTSRLKYESRINMGQSPDSEDCNKDGIGLPFLQGNAEFGLKSPSAKQFCSVSRKVAKKGDFLFSVRAPVGAVNISDREYGIGRGLCGISATGKISSDFLWWHLSLIRSELNSISTGSTFEAVSAEQVGNSKIVLPPAGEQIQIARFLDHETAKIDRLIRRQEALIDLLKEKREAVISHVVTKGLNPTAPMKDSGVEWLGAIPRHWDLKRLRYLGQLQNGLSLAGEKFGSGYPFISYGDVYKNRILPLIGSGLVQSSREDREACSVKRGDVFFTRTSETVEEIGISSVCFEDIKDATFAGFLIRFRPNRDCIDIGFSRYYFSGMHVRRFFVGEMNLVTRASLSQDLLKSLIVAMPPLSEQEVIFTFLKGLDDQFDSLIENAARKIPLLQERRAALISAAVTGKIDVRDWRAPEPDATEDHE